MKKILFILIIASFISCKKANRVHPDLVGTWTHYSGNGNFYKIWIGRSGYGNVVNKTDKGYEIDTQRRVWRVKDDKLIFSSFKRFVYTIDEYPTIANITLIENYDTIQQGRTYIRLDGNLFRKQ